MSSQRGIYGVWDGMMRRCYSIKHVHYSRYGGRGIRVCKRWHSFANFEKDMLPSYVKGLRLERVENDGIYKKSNCIWATPKQQALNRSSTVFLTIDNTSLCIKDWALKTGQNYSTIRHRVVAGYSHKECVFGIRKENQPNRHKKWVLNLSTGEIYNNGTEAANKLGKSRSHISKILCGERIDSIGIRYIDEEEFRNLKALNK